ncbi:MAG: hypothetical protein PVJ92_00310 [Candidatus Dependentiae bacterium]
MFRLSRSFLLYISCSLILPLAATSPVINRYFPHITKEPFSLVTGRTAQLSVSSSAAHTSKTFAQVSDERAGHRLDGLLEIDGAYDLKAIAYSANATFSNYTLPFFRETGGHAWLDRNLVFDARSSLSMYAAHLQAQLPLWDHVMVGAYIPFMHVEARQRYYFPADGRTRYSPSDRDQVERLQRALHSDIGLQSGDWQVDGLGDTTVWAQYERTWSYVGVLRQAQLGARLSCSAPTGRQRNEAFAASVPFGANGHWGVGVTVQPAAELKENIFLHLPCTFVWQAPRTTVTRLPVFNEPAAFSALKGAVRIKPGFSWCVAPQLSFAHAMGVDNLHLSVAFHYTRHYADVWEDVRSDKSVDSFLTRKTAYPGASAAATQQNIQKVNNGVREQKKHLSKTGAGYLVWDLQYELREFFSSKHAPLVRASYEHCVTGYQTGRTNQLTLQIGWRF